MSQSNDAVFPKVSAQTQYIIAGTVRNYLAGFLVERRSRRLAKGTLRYYEKELNQFCIWLDSQGVMKLDEVKADVIRQYLLSLEATRNAGGIHASYRAIRAFYSWLEVEFEEEGRRNPMRKVMAPKVNKQAREGASVETIRAMIEACKEGKNVLRDRLIMMVLFDTGMRAGELLALDVEDVDPMSGAVVIQHGKGDKRRVVYLGAKSRKSLRNYLKLRGYSPGALFLTDEGERIKYMGLRRLIERRAINAKVKAPGLHDFRRAFAVTMLRNGCELLKLAELLGHNTLEVTRRYIHLVDEDLRLAHAMSGPVDKNL